ncbi:MAG: glycan-binding surface protein [Dysgonamonadaceae bacterium]|jgi:hypothetical protein|nr:glycan-binding surface protein [Dysgonamonadaceae bacterium]
MKKIILFRNICAGALLLFALSFAACSDKDEGGSSGPITLSSITTIADMNTPISQAAMGDFIAVHGTGLDVRNIDSIYINDIKLDLGEVYTENSILYLMIPVKLPLVESNKIYIYNKTGVHEFALIVVPPNLSLERMFNEYTMPGDTIMIYGYYFDLYEINPENGVVDFNGKTSPVIASADRYLLAKVPVDVDKNIRVKVRSIKYDTEAVCPGYYYDNREMILDFDTKLPSNTNLIVTDPTDKMRLSGNFLRLDGTEEWGGWWYICDGVYYGNFTEDQLDHWNDYVIKCEFRTSNQFIADKIRFCTYLFWDAEPMYWVASDFNVQNFDRWETIQLPFTRNYSATYPQNQHYQSFSIRLEIDPSIARNFAFDNFRICKKGD